MKQVTRRSFLHHMSLGAGSLGAAQILPAFITVPAVASNNANAKLNVALCGLGNYAGLLAEGLQHSQYCRLAGIVTGHPEKAKDWQQRYGLSNKHIYNYENFDRIADDQGIDLVYVVLPNALHKDFVVRAARAGKHVITEKPMATTVGDCKVMIDACKKAGVQLAVGYRLHFDPYHIELKRLGQEKVFGPVRFMEASLGYKTYDALQASVGYVPGDPDNWRLNKQLAGGGPLMDLGIYCVQCCRYVLGEEPIAVTSQSISTRSPKLFSEVEESIMWQMTFASGATSNCATSYGFNIDRFFATADSGEFELSPGLSYGPFKGSSSKGSFDFPIINQQAVQLDAIGKMILNNQPLPAHISGEEGLRDVNIIESIYKAAQTGQRVAVPNI